MHGTVTPAIAAKVTQAKEALELEGFEPAKDRIGVNLFHASRNDLHDKGIDFMEFRLPLEGNQFQLITFVCLPKRDGALQLNNSRTWRVIGARVSVEEYVQAQKASLDECKRIIMNKPMPNVSVSEFLNRGKLSAKEFMLGREAVMRRKISGPPGFGGLGL